MCIQPQRKSLTQEETFLLLNVSLSLSLSLMYFSRRFLQTMEVNNQIQCYLCVYIAYLTNQAVMFPADGAVEDIDCVLVHTPAKTVWSGTVVAALTSRLCH